MVALRDFAERKPLLKKCQVLLSLRVGRLLPAANVVICVLKIECTVRRAPNSDGRNPEIWLLLLQ